MKWLLDLFSRNNEPEQKEPEAEKPEATLVEPTSKPRRPAFYFSGGGLDEKSMIYDRLPCPYGIIDSEGEMTIIRRRSQYPVVKTVKTNGRKFIARQLEGYLLFREPDSPPAPDALFMADTDFEEFAENYDEEEVSGRCMMYIPTCMDENNCLYLFFDSGGESSALHLRVRHDVDGVQAAIEHEKVEFWWEYLAETDDIRTLSTEELHKLGEKVFLRQINRSLSTPYILHPELTDVPLSWESGSEQELRQLAHAICCTEPGLFDTGEPVTVVFRAATEDKRGGFLYVIQDWERVTSRRLMSLCDLAFRLNPCTGMHWNVEPGTIGYLNKAAERILVTVEPPTAHEKAEAYLTLVDWLDEKLHDPQKRAQYGLPPLTAT